MQHILVTSKIRDYIPVGPFTVILLLLFFLALVVSATLVPIWRTLALRFGYVIVPPDDGQSQSRAKARFGGVAIPVTLLICSIAVDAFSSVPVLLVCSGALFLFGVVSDLLGTKPSTKVIALIVIASVFLFFDRRLYWADSAAVDSLVTILWIVGITSAFNLLDNMDGLCGGIALIAGTGFLFTVLPLSTDSPLFLETQYLVVLLGAVAGFLVYNIYPASVALGDSGSLVIGLNMAAMTLQFAPGRGSDLVSIVAVPALLLLIPIVDAMLVAVSRLLSASSVAGREYSSHRLVAIGLSERGAVGLLWVLAGVSGLIGVMADRRQDGLAGLMAAMFTIGIALFAAFLARVQIHEDASANELRGRIMPGIVAGYRRRIGEVFLDLLLVSVAYYGAYRLRFEGVEFTASRPIFLQSFPIVLGTQMIALFAVGAYRGMWRYFSLSDGVMFVKGVFVGVLTSQAVLLYLYRFRDYSLGVFVIYGMLLLLLLVGSRASFRALSEFVQRQRTAGRRIAIYGAGDSGSMAVRRLLHDSRNAYRIIGFIDDDAQKWNVRVHGFRILGGYEYLVDLIMGGRVDAVVIAHESLSTSGLGPLCERYGVILYRLRLDWLEFARPPGPDSEASPRLIEAAAVPRSSVLRADAVVRHAFSVDVEDWFHGIPVDGRMKDAAAPRLERGLHVLLDLLGERSARATFFILGPLVTRHTAVLRRIAAEGHELGCHGWSHDLIYTMSPKRFAEETRQARDAIADLTGSPVKAFRAPYFSITRDSLWALEVLAELGFTYDSSIFPVRNWRYGIEDFSRDPVLMHTSAGPLWEFPISVMERYGQTIPVSGGAYFRLYPYSLTRANFKAQERLRRRVIFYLHPWELDPDHPQVSFAWRPRFTHYANLQSTRPKLVRLLREFSFGTIGETIPARA